MPLGVSTALAVCLYVAAAILPGLAVLRALGLGGPDPTVRVGLAAGVGLALHPLIFLWARWLGIPLGAGAWWVLLAASALVGLWPRRAAARPAAGIGDRAAAVCLGALAALAMAAGWWAARDLSVPMWGDSVHHALIARLLVEHGGLVGDWLPEVPLATFTYHFGLHAGVAGLSWLTGLPPHRALIVAGQALLALQALTAYALAAGLTGRRWAGVGAALAAAGLSPMPGYYVNWGRYTQLAGQTVLPAAALLAFAAARAQSGDRAGRWRAVAGAALAVAGLALTHYLVTATFALLALAWWLGDAAPGAPRRSAAAALAWLACVGLASVAIAAPWIPAMAEGLLFQTAAAVTADALPPAVYGATAADALRATLPGVLLEHARLRVGWPLLAATAMGAAWALAERERLARVGVLWAVLLAVAAYPWLVGLPIGAVLKDFTVAIGFYVPLGLVIGGALGDAVERAARRRRAAPAAAAAVVLAAAVAMAPARWAAPVAEHRLVVPADEAAMAWVRANTAADAVFLVSGFMAFGDTVAAGDDAGWWLPQLAERRATLPPITYGLERPVEPGYREAVNAVYERLPAGIDDPALAALLDERGVTHAFVGATARALDGDALAASPRWRAVYDEGGARVFERVGGGAAR